MSTSKRKQNPVDSLRKEFARRKSVNKRYSMRAFARSLELSSGRLSELLNGKRNISSELGEKICKKLNLNEQDAISFLASVAQQNAYIRSSPLAQSDRQLARKGVKYEKLADDVFRSIVDWEHHAILALLQTREFSPNVTWIAKRLGITAEAAENAIDRLDRLRLIETSGSKWTIPKDNLTTTHDIPSEAIRQSHKQSMLKAMESLDAVPVELRDITAMTLAIDVTKLAEAKNLIRTFRRALTKYLETGSKNEVYKLNIQLFPVTKR